MRKVLNFLGFCGLLLNLAQFVWAADSRIQLTKYTTIVQPKPEFNPPRRIVLFVREPALSFADAVTACGIRGNVLAEFKKLVDVQFLNNALKNGTMGNLQNVGYIYLGGAYIGPSQVDGTKPVFKWFESGTDVTNWAPGQPNKLLNGLDENCVVAFKSPQGPWRVGGSTCMQKFPFICSSIEGLSI